ncbi:MAG: class I SAM-dependent methyltransferase [Shimia sp.]|jgi:hypothetical protein|uniref:class I SAM-dependent methyltransferase n=1 Tax=Shimia sp. TaxID=1954381 RepID=UPI004059DEF5
MKKLDGYHRHEVLKLIEQDTGLIGVELGVAGGEFSRRMVESGRFDQFFGVDMYADTHDVHQYKAALRHVGLMRPYKLLRMSFAEAHELFDDESLDFIYIDGYAHTGQEGGETIWQWATKVKVGGLIAGDDFHEDWPLVIEAVKAFTAQTGFDLYVTTEVEPDVEYAGHPTWAMIKSAPTTGAPPTELLTRGKSEAARVHKKRMAGMKLDAILRKLVNQDRYDQLRAWNKERKKNRNPK